MATITAALVKDLRERTGAGMMECKKNLVAVDGDIEAAIEAMRKSGLAKADKKADRIAAEGSIVVSRSNHSVSMVEVNSETDFVVGSEDYKTFAQKVADVAVESNCSDVNVLAEKNYESGVTINTARQSLIAKIGENINVRRVTLLGSENTIIGDYLHGARIGVLVELDGGDAILAKDIAMHIAASKPVCIDESGVPQALLDKEKDIFSSQAAESGKPPEIIEKMVTGRLKKYLKEVTLLGQPFIKDPDTTIEKLLTKSSAKVISFTRFEVGEGIEKKEDNFAEEVMAQAQGS